MFPLSFITPHAAPNRAAFLTKRPAAWHFVEALTALVAATPASIQCPEETGLERHLFGDTSGQRTREPTEDVRKRLDQPTHSKEFNSKHQMLSSYRSWKIRTAYLSVEGQPSRERTKGAGNPGAINHIRGFLRTSMECSK